MSSEPTTQAGKRALADEGPYWQSQERMRRVILAIEAEVRADLEAKVRALPYRIVEWFHEDGTYSLHQVVTWSEVLRLLTDGADK